MVTATIANTQVNYVIMSLFTNLMGTSFHFMQLHIF